MLARLSLRARLLLGVVALATVGLAVADVATYTSLRSFLLDRVDRSLQAGHVQVEHTAFGDSGPPRGGGRGGGSGNRHDGDFGPPFRAFDRQPHGPAGGGVFHRVVYQVEQELFKPRAVAAHRYFTICA